MTIDELIAQIKTEIGDDKDKAKEFATKLDQEVKAASQPLIDKGVGKGKNEKSAELSRVTRERDDLKTELEERTAEIEDLKAKQPDRAAIEAELTGKFQKKLDAAKAEAEKHKTDLTTERRTTRLAKLHAALIKEGVDPDYARLEHRTYADRFEIGDDGTVKVLQLGSKDAYDADSDETAIAALASDIRKSITNPKWIVTNVDSGGGASGREGGGSAYDPAAEGKKRGEQQRATKEKNSLAFR